MKNKIIFALLFGAATLFASCGKDVTPQPKEEPGPTGDKTAPTVPTNVAGTATQNSVALTWTASTDNVGVTSYKVYRNGTLAGSPTGNAYTDAGLAANTDYRYTVAAYDAAGNASTVSNEITVKTLNTPPPTTAPTATTTSGSASGQNSVSVSGSVTSDGGASTTVYAVRKWYQDGTDMNNGQNMADSVQIGTGIGTYSYTWTNGIAGTEYTMYISAKNNVGYSKGVDKNGTTNGYHKYQILKNASGVNYAKVYKVTADGNHKWFAALVTFNQTWDNLFPSSMVTNATSVSDGRANTAQIMSMLSGPSIARSAYNYTAGGAVPVGTFYQGSQNECLDLQASGIFPAYTNVGAPTYGDISSSTEYSAISAKVVSNSGVATPREKGQTQIGWYIGYD